ncbi:MAG: carbamoyltransferase HypF [Candidatus Bathyarchaeia archaeon]
MRVKVNISGIVQGVGFRPFIYNVAEKYGLAGYVQNKGDAGVEILLEGSAWKIEKFMEYLIAKKPLQARIDKIKKIELSGQKEFRSFTIYKSSTKKKKPGSIIPPDIAICKNCLAELRDPTNPRFNYFFITCTDCGPRFTIIERLPYDRENTTMNKFSLCSFCQEEYETPSNRRFHAQTVACSTCGPKAYLTTNTGETVQTVDPVRMAGKLLSEGKILAIKGYGGFHIASSTTLNEPLRRLRQTKHRKEKPFAIMAKNLETAKSIGIINSKEQKLLISPQRPIVLLNKNSNYDFSPLIVPGLHNVGVMLPYSGLHYMLFDEVDDTSFVMTSANPPNQPIVKDNNTAVEILGHTVDYFLFHNREIAHRCDDSVMRVHGIHQVFIRRSRGYTPVPIRLKHNSKRCIVCLGGELNNTSTILFEDKAFISQHIGDIENIETQTFLQEATQHLQHLTNTRANVIACDLHPKFSTTRLAKEIAEADRLPLVQIQHHHAHAAALMAEHGLDDIIAITCDGYGYGLDGKAWGGEILYTKNMSTDFNRLAHLECQLLLGGDIASRFPLRIVAAMLFKTGIDVTNWLKQKSDLLVYGKLEANLISDQLKKGMVEPQTTSCGRVLDAISALLGVCTVRSYEGEPAIKLESAAINGKDVLKLKPRINGNTLQTSYLIKEVFENLGKVSTADLAYSAHAYLAKGLASLAIEQAQKKGTKNVGFSGGASCNQILSKTIREVVEAADLQFIVHNLVPAGDGGVSFGQAVVASNYKY